MAGTIEGFDPAEFRAAIRMVMEMGAAPDLADQPVFYFPQAPINTAFADVEYIPFDPSARPVEQPPIEVRVPCTVEFEDVPPRQESFGVINATKIRITVLDEDYVKIRGFSYVKIDDDTYKYVKAEPPVGLGQVGVWTIHAVAEDES